MADNIEINITVPAPQPVAIIVTEAPAGEQGPPGPDASVTATNVSAVLVDALSIVGSSALVPIGAAAANISIVAETTAARMLSALDYSRKVRLSNAAGCVLTIPVGIGVAGAAIIFRRNNSAGAVSISTDVGVTLNNDGAASVLAGQEFALMAVSLNEWDFI